jgi:hypothetical protein
MTHSERVAIACEAGMSSGKFSPRLVQRVLACKSDVPHAIFRRHFWSADTMIQEAAISILSKFGEHQDCEEIVDLLESIKDESLVRRFMCCLRGSEMACEIAEGLIGSDNSFAKEEAIGILRRAGRRDTMTALLFDDNPAIVNRAKRYMKDARND